MLSASYAAVATCGLLRHGSPAFGVIINFFC